MNDSKKKERLLFSRRSFSNYSFALMILTGLIILIFTIGNMRERTDNAKTRMQLKTEIQQCKSF